MADPSDDDAAVTETVCMLSEIAPGTARRALIGGVPVAVVRIDDAVYAIGDICSHANVSLSDGEVWCDEREIECPKHGSAFSLVDGQPNTLPATQPVQVYRAAVVDGAVTVTVNGAGDPGAGSVDSGVEADSGVGVEVGAS